MKRFLIYDRANIHELAAKFNLNHHSVRESPKRHIKIGKLGSKIGPSNSRKTIYKQKFKYAFNHVMNKTPCKFSSNKNKIYGIILLF